MPWHSCDERTYVLAVSNSISLSLTNVHYWSFQTAYAAICKKWIACRRESLALHGSVVSSPATSLTPPIALINLQRLRLPIMATVNILQSLQSLIAGPMAEQAASFLGESQSNVKSGVETLLPNLLGAIVHRSSTPDGASALLSALDSPAMKPGLLSTNLSGLFAGGPATRDLMQNGSSLLSSLFGPKIGDMSNAIAGLSGLRGQSAMSLLSMAAPFVLGMVKQAAFANQMYHPAGVGALLESQKSYLTGRLSDRIFSALGLGGVAAALGGVGAGVANAAGNAASSIGRAAVPAGTAAKSAGGGVARWLPWILAAMAALFALSYCAKKTPSSGQLPNAATSASSSVAGTSTSAAAGSAPVSVQSMASAVTATAQDAAKAVSEVIPLGSGIVADMFDGHPMLKVYFESGKTGVSADFSDKAKDVLAYLKSDAQAKLSVSGFSDPTGDKALNEQLSKQRANAVKDALVAAGVSAERISLDKPAEITGTGGNNQARRVEIRIVK